jgi:hypothetical protein
MSKYVRVVFSIKMRIDANVISIGNGKVKCSRYLKENLSKLKCNLTKMSYLMSKTKRTLTKIILDKKVFTIIIIILLLIMTS